MKKIVAITCSWAIIVGLFAQPADSLVRPSDTTFIQAGETILKEKKEKEKKPFLYFLKEKDPQYAPKKAAFYSIIFPGGGQIYNKQYWKAPLAMAAVGGVIYLANENTVEYRRFRNAYRLRVDGDPNTVDEFANVAGATNETLVRLRDSYRKRMEQSYLGIVAVYALNVVEAYTAAHLRNFDVSEELGLQWQPTFQLENSLGGASPYVQIGVAVRLSKRPPVRFY